MATKYFVLNNTDPDGNIVIGRNSLWSSVYNWALSSGGNDNAGPPGPDDDAVFDGNSVWRRGTPSFNEVILDGTQSSPNVCRNLTINTGFAWNIRQQYNNGGLAVYGELSLTGSEGAPITLNPLSDNQMNIYCLGTCGPIVNVVANNIFSFGGNRIYYDDIGGGCTITNCPFWLHPNPPSWVSGKNYIVGDYVFNSTFGHSYLCQYPNLSGSFGADLSLGYWLQADQGDIPAIPNRITVRVTNATELQLMATAPDYDYVLDNDIDLTGFNWTPVGTANFTLSTVDQNPFTGSFNGQNHKISNLTYSDTDSLLCSALFGAVGSGQPFYGNNLAYISPVIKNVTLNNFNLSGYEQVAGLIGECWTAQITNIHVNNIVLTGLTGGSYSLASFGGLIGECAGLDGIPTIITNCTVYGVTITGAQLQEVGGLIGDSFLNTSDGLPSSLVITNCYVNGISITDTSAEMLYGGGFIGSAEGTFERCYSEGSIVGSQIYNGGFFGAADTLIIKDCYARVNMTSTAAGEQQTGGFIGFLEAPANITNCYSDGTISGVSGATNYGGFIAQTQAGTLANPISILNSYSVGVITITDSNNYSGGFIGHVGGTSGNAPYTTFSNCWWYTGAFSVAVGTNDIRSTTGETLTAAGYGGDETDNTHFYSHTHPVYASGDTPSYGNFMEDDSGQKGYDDSGQVGLAV